MCAVMLETSVMCHKSVGEIPAIVCRYTSFDMVRMTRFTASVIVGKATAAL